MNELHAEDDAQNATEEVPTCSVCYEPLKDKITSPECCEHLFCFGCLTDWARQNPTCPLDRKPFVKIITRNQLCDQESGVILIEWINYPEYFNYFLYDSVNDIEDRSSINYLVALLNAVDGFRKEIVKLLQHEGFIYIFVDEENCIMEFDKIAGNLLKFEDTAIDSFMERLSEMAL